MRGFQLGMKVGGLTFGELYVMLNTKQLLFNAFCLYKYLVPTSCRLRGGRDVTGIGQHIYMFALRYDTIT